MSFMFENLDVYKRAVQFAGTVDFLAQELKGKVSYSVIDQLTRATLSISLNIAEGNGRWHKADKRQFFWISRGSIRGAFDDDGQINSSRRSVGALKR